MPLRRKSDLSQYTKATKRMKLKSKIARELRLARVRDLHDKNTLVNTERETRMSTERTHIATSSSCASRGEDNSKKTDDTDVDREVHLLRAKTNCDSNTFSDSKVRLSSERRLKTYSRSQKTKDELARLGEDNSQKTDNTDVDREIHLFRDKSNCDSDTFSDSKSKVRFSFERHLETASLSQKTNEERKEPSPTVSMLHILSSDYKTSKRLTQPRLQKLDDIQELLIPCSTAKRIHYVNFT